MQTKSANKLTREEIVKMRNAREAKRTNAVYPALRRVVLGEGDYSYEDAWVQIVEHREDIVRRLMATVYEGYGRVEMTNLGLTPDDARQEILLGLYNATKRYVWDDKLSVNDQVRKWCNYTHIHMDAALKRALEDANGISKSYAFTHLRMKKLGLDLWSSPTELLHEAIRQTRPGIKDPGITLQRLREVLSTKRVPLYEAQSEEMRMPTDAEDFAASCEEVRKLMGDDLGYRIFLDFYNPETHVTKRSLALNYGVTGKRINEALEDGKKAAAQVFQDSLYVRKYMLRKFLRETLDNQEPVAVVMEWD